VALSNKEQVAAGLDVLAESLEPLVARVLTKLIPAGQPWTVIPELKDESRGRARTDTDPYNPLDLKVQLRVINERLGELGFPFDGPLSRAETQPRGRTRGRPQQGRPQRALRAG
jgi:hypothetical protein